MTEELCLIDTDVHDLTLVTNNERHYDSVKEHFPIKISNWMKD